MTVKYRYWIFFKKWKEMVLYYFLILEINIWLCRKFFCKTASRKSLWSFNTYYFIYIYIYYLVLSKHFKNSCNSQIFYNRKNKKKTVCIISFWCAKLFVIRNKGYQIVFTSNKSHCNIYRILDILSFYRIPLYQGLDYSLLGRKFSFITQKLIIDLKLEG